MDFRINTGIHQLVLALFAAFFFLTGCQNNLQCMDQTGCIILSPGQPIIIGVERATTGDESALSESMIDALRFANRQQPLFLKHPVQFYIQDTPCTLRDHIFSAGLLVSQPDVVAVIGPVCQAGTADYAKIVSDAGFALLSPSTAIDPTNLPGVYDLFPSPKALAGEMDLLLSQKPEIKDIDLMVWNAANNIQFSTDFCILWQKRGHRCDRILFLQPDNLNIAIVPDRIFGLNSTLIFIIPFSTIAQIPDFHDVLKDRMTLFFDPELGAWDKDQDPYRLTRRVITYPLQVEKNSLSLLPVTGLPEIRSLLAYDSYTLLLRSLSETVEVLPDGKIVILRQKLQLSFETIAGFDGMAGAYSCSNRNSCLDMKGFLELRAPTQ